MHCLGLGRSVALTFEASHRRDAAFERVAILLGCCCIGARQVVELHPRQSLAVARGAQRIVDGVAELMAVLSPALAVPRDLHGLDGSCTAQLCSHHECGNGNGRRAEHLAQAGGGEAGKILSRYARRKVQICSLASHDRSSGVDCSILFERVNIDTFYSLPLSMTASAAPHGISSTPATPSPAPPPPPAPPVPPPPPRRPPWSLRPS